MKLAGQLAIVAVAALAFTVVPGGGGALAVALTTLSVAFFAAIGFLGWRMWHQFRFELESLQDRERWVLYGSIGLVLLAICGGARMFASGGFGVLAWFALLGICAYGLFWVWTRYRRLA